MIKPRTPNELSRIYQASESRSTSNQRYFASIDVGEYRKSEGEGNAAYIILQAQEYERAIKMGDDSVMRAHAASELSRILALCHREAIRLNRDFIELLWEGVVYEEDVIKDIEAGRRKRRSNRGLDRQAPEGSK